jgi:hypothetical protein
MASQVLVAWTPLRCTEPGARCAEVMAAAAYGQRGRGGLELLDPSNLNLNADDTLPSTSI